MNDKIVELIRRFTPMSARSAEWDFLMPGTGKPQPHQPSPPSSNPAAIFLRQFPQQEHQTHPFPTYQIPPAMFSPPRQRIQKRDRSSRE